MSQVYTLKFVEFSELLGFIFYRLVIMVSNNSCDNCGKLRMGLANLILDYNKIKEDLNELQEFKKRHDEQLSRLLGSPSHNLVSRQRTIGYQDNLKNTV